MYRLFLALVALTLTACTTQALFDAGRAMGRAADIPWLTADDLQALAEGG